MSEYTTPLQESDPLQEDTSSPPEASNSASASNRFITATRTLDNFLDSEIERPDSILGEVFPEGLSGCSMANLDWAKPGWR